MFDPRKACWGPNEAEMNYRHMKNHNICYSHVTRRFPDLQTWAQETDQNIP